MNFVYCCIWCRIMCLNVRLKCCQHSFRLRWICSPQCSLCSMFRVNRFSGRTTVIGQILTYALLISDWIRWAKTVLKSTMATWCRVWIFFIAISMTANCLALNMTRQWQYEYNSFVAWWWKREREREKQFPIANDLHQNYDEQIDLWMYLWVAWTRDIHKIGIGIVITSMFYGLHIKLQCCLRSWNRMSTEIPFRFSREHASSTHQVTERQTKCLIKFVQCIYDRMKQEWRFRDSE